MLIELRIIISIIIVILMVLFVAMLRSQKLNLKYCLVWIVALLGITVFCIFPGLLDKLSHILGIGVPVNTLFLICIIFLTCICISLTIVVSRLSDKLRKLTQNIALMEYETGKKSNSSEKDI